MVLRVQLFELLAFFRIEMVDKLDPPLIPDGYALTLGFACLLEICHSVELNILSPASSTDMTSTSTAQRQALNEGDKKLYESLVNSSWGGLLASLTLLLDAR